MFTTRNSGIGAAVAAAAAALAIAGCGGSGAGHDSGTAATAEKTVRTYMHDVIAKDGEAACRVFTDNWKQSVEEQYAAYSGATGRTDCATLIQQSSNGDHITFDGEEVTDARVDTIDFKTSLDDNDGSPVATLVGEHGKQEYDLHYETGSWKISGVRDVGGF